jgi:hypothetical protein
VNRSLRPEVTAHDSVWILDDTIIGRLSILGWFEVVARRKK